MMIAIPPKYAVSQVIGYIKGKSAIPSETRGVCVFTLTRFSARDDSHHSPNKFDQPVRHVLGVTAVTSRQAPFF
jgi:hypothetical protein